jgi:hypothetical protein
MDFATVNYLAVIAYALILIAFALGYIIYRQDRKSSKR